MTGKESALQRLRKSLLDRRNRKCKGFEAATGMVILRHSKQATKVEESYPKSGGKVVGTDWVGSWRLYGKDLELYSNCSGKLLRVLSRDET